MKNRFVQTSLLAVALVSATFAQAPDPTAGKSDSASSAALPAPRELQISFDGTAKGTDLITVSRGDTIELQATVKNVSEKTVTILGTGPNALSLTPSGKKLAPGESTKMPLLVYSRFASFPISVFMGAAYAVEGDTAVRFGNTHARVAVEGIVLPSVDRVSWRGDEVDERKITVETPTGFTLKDIKVAGDFTARLEGGIIYVRPQPSKPGETATGPVVTVPLPPGAVMVPANTAGRKNLAVGSITLVVDPAPNYRVATIGLSAQPQPQFVAATVPAKP